MDRNQYNRIRVAVTFFVGAVVALAVSKNSLVLSTAGIVTGIVFMILARSKAKIRTDEREVAVQEKAARITYAIFAPTLGISALLLLFPSMSRLPVFAKGEFGFPETLGTIFAYLTLFLIAVYAISYHYLNRKYGGGGDEE